MKQLTIFAMACMLVLSLGACASTDKDVEASLAELDGPLYAVTVRTMLRLEPQLEAEATGVIPQGSMVYLRETAEDEAWVLVTAPGAGDVVFKGWLPVDRLQKMEE